ncbi:MAG: hypothetical protein CL844_06725 [Crocinitomicaceae bacterium]|nr:hypothetical protein [Crocinitomicaceae bacterium]|tara:strand:+ start:62942 stop:66289 length:3348 start_codon:yes stop_codon:yes gene_type:complete
MSHFDALLLQLDSFIRKFYKNQIIKGVFLFVGIFLISFLFVVTLEFFGRFNSFVRGALFLGFLSSNFFVLAKYIAIPALRLKSFGKRIDRKQASIIVGEFFPGISDRLINTLQLNDQTSGAVVNYELINASIEKRSESLRRFNFLEAIDIKESKKHLKWVVPVVFLFFLIGGVSPSVISNGTKRVVNFSKDFVEPAPFKFVLLTKQMTVEEGSDFDLLLRLDGKEVPEKVYYKSNKGRFLLEKTSKNTFKTTINQIREDCEFFFEANQFKSEKHKVKVEGKTVLGKFEATLKYPKYIGKKTEVIKNAKNLTIEEGTTVIWSALTKNTSKARVFLDTTQLEYKDRGFTFKKRFLKSSFCRILLSNKQNNKVDTTAFFVDVIKDQYPTISVEEKKDTLKMGARYFSGNISDDYGFAFLKFVYLVKKQNDSTPKRVEISLGDFYGVEREFSFAVDFAKEDLSLEDEVEYFFVVGDNDGVNGTKKTKSKKFKYTLPSLMELNSKRDEEQEVAKNKLKSVLKEASRFNEKIEKLRKDNLNKNNENWKNKNEINQLQEQQKGLIEDLKSLKEEINNSIEEKTQLSDKDKNLLEQQELINNLLEDLMDDELKNLLKELEDLLKENMFKNEIDKKLEELETGSEDMEKQLDRSLEMLKKLQVNEKIEDIQKWLEKLSEEQNQLAEKTKNKKNISNEEAKQQNEIKENFDQLKKEINELDSLNKKLENPLTLDKQEDKQEEVTKSLEESNKQMQKDNGSKASQSQKSAAKKMKEMAQSFAAMKSQSNRKQAEEDLEMLRSILEGLLILSIDQEDLIYSFKRVDDSDPAFHAYTKKQRKLIDNSQTIRDSLLTLAKRQPKIARFVDKELAQIKSNHTLILEDIGERRKTPLSNHQRYVMTAYNNLALMLNETLSDLQNMMQLPGTGSCNKPGGSGTPSPGSTNPGDIKQMLKDQLEKMKNGSNPGGENQGEAGSGKKGEGKKEGLGSKELAKMAAEQGALRRALEKMRSEMNKTGEGKGNALNPLLKELKEQEKNLINKTQSKELINRQQKILTRLLESEKAMIERGRDDSRESKEGFFENNSNKIHLKEYNKQKEKQMEMLRLIDPVYQKYYKDKANQYFLKGM